MSKSGTLLGLAYGDVLGCPVETWSATQIQQVYGVYGGVPKAYPLERIPAEQHKRLRPLGLHSDDTQQALALIHLSKSGFALESWKSWLVEGLRSGAFRGYGRNFSGAVQKLRKGGDLRGSGSNSAGMGAAMRVAPLAALHETPEALADEVVASSLMTHGNAVAVFTAAAVALTAFGFLQGMDQVKIIAVLPDWLRATETRWLERPGWSFDHSAGHLVSENPGGGPQPASRGFRGPAFTGHPAGQAPSGRGIHPCPPQPGVWTPGRIAWPLDVSAARRST